ncbi:MAG: hypothetical protein J0L64_19340 [Acidobacteria bacterium]|nr:hypothetical protein [Acidobacteriota bacterium]
MPVIHSSFRLIRASALVLLTVSALAQTAPRPPAPLQPGQLRRLGTVDERFQSYNVEMVEVTGGRFWAPYRAQQPAATTAPPTGAPTLDPSLFRQREPINLAGSRLRRLAAALGPAYMRVSGTWANSTYFHDEDGRGPSTPPTGFGGVLTRDQWRGVVAFSQAVDAPIVTSFAISEGARGPDGVWTTDQLRRFLRFNQSLGGNIAAAEFFNEPNIPAMGGAPKGYDAAAYRRDFARFHAFLRTASPTTRILGPGAVAEPDGQLARFTMLSSFDLLGGSLAQVDALSYHFYGGVSKRCAAMSPGRQLAPENALTPEWLSRTERDLAFYTALRDRLDPKKPLWLTETAEAACGGNPWASTFLDTFRYLSQMGRLARGGVQVIAHNTLAASDYALIDEETMTPRPSYWAALLWRRLMDRTVLDAGPPPSPTVETYAHCLRGVPGGVALLAINTSRDQAFSLPIPRPASLYLLTSPNLESARADLNGAELKLSPSGALPSLQPRSASSPAALPPAGIAFLAFPNAGNPACRLEP